MIGFHFQNSPNGWPSAVAKLPSNAMTKLLFGVERARESKAANPGVKTWYRWVGDQPLHYGNFEQHCRDWLDQFVDGTFRREAEHVDYIQGYNETLANSQPQEERDRWIALHTAMAKVWHDEYRQEEALQHIRIILCETAIGNDIPWQIAEAAQWYDAVLGYHPYVVCRVGKLTDTAKLQAEIYPTRHDAPRAKFQGGGIYRMRETILGSVSEIMVDDIARSSIVSLPNYVSLHDWRWYSGRWATMDAEYKARGITVDWAFGEGGPVLDASEDWSGWLDPLGGWKNDDCLGGDLEKYKAVLDYWLQNTFQTPAYQEGRILGLQLFTSGAPGGSGGQWGNFDLIGDDMQHIAEFSGAYDYPETGPTEPPVDPPVDPPTDCRGLPRTQYARRVLVVPQDATMAEWLSVCERAYASRQSVGFSYDDGGIGDLDNRTVILYGLRDDRRAEFWDWYKTHYPGVAVAFRDYAALFEIVDIVDELPTHATKTYNTRSLEDVHTLIIHHTTGDAFGSTVDIASFHVNGRNWAGIGYHYLIDGAGGIEQVNRHETISAHARYHNDDSVGISLKGSFVGDAMPSEDQLMATAWLVNKLKRELPIEKVIGHKDTAYSQTPGHGTRCPGDTWEAWKNEVI